MKQEKANKKKLNNGYKQKKTKSNNKKNSSDFAQKIYLVVAASRLLFCVHIFIYFPKKKTHTEFIHFS